MKCSRCGGEGATLNGNGRTYHRACGKYGKVSPEEIALVRAGTAPEFGLINSAAAGTVMGKVTVQRAASGEVISTWARYHPDEDRRREAMLAAIDAMVADLPKLPPRRAPGTWRSDLLTVYPIGDPHIGMYSWGAETGEDWDLAIAERVHCSAMAELVQAVPATEQAVILNLGDMFHYDGLRAETPRSGHALDADGRYAKMIDVGIKIMRQCIESALAKHKALHVMNLPGNHDESSALFMSVAMRHMYEREPRVTVEASPALFQYYRWGRVLIGAHHGHAAKPDKLPGVMACDRAKDWGETTHRHWLTGHVHHESKREFSGVTVESFNTLAANDAFATNGGWRSGRSMQALVFHREHGEVARSKVHAAMFDAAA